MLIKASLSSAASAEGPVIGSITNDAFPTSGDVHLYSDVSTIESSQPMLYADSEGLYGGESIPMGMWKSGTRMQQPSWKQTKL